MKANPCNYPNDGLSYNLGYLEATFPKVLWWSMEAQAELVDGVTKEHAASAEFCARFITPPGEFVSVGTINATSVGNLAFLAMHAHPDHVQEYRRIYDELIASWKSQIEQKNASCVII